MRQETEPELLKKIIGFQREEITSCIIYKKLATIEKIRKTGKFCNVFQKMKAGTMLRYAVTPIGRLLPIVGKSFSMYGWYAC